MNKEKSPKRVQKSDAKESIKEEKSNLNSEGILLTLISASAYIFAFFYERGYANYFGIPNDLITVSINNALLFFAFVFGFLIFLYIVLELSATIFQSLNPIWLRILIPLFAVFTLVLINIYFFGIQEWKRWFEIFLVLVLLTLLQFIFPLITQRGKGKYIEKLFSQEQSDAQFPGIAVLLTGRSGIYISRFLALFVFGIFLAGSAGTSEALKKEEFLVMQFNPEIAVLRVYGDMAICAQFDRNTKELTNKFVLVPLKQNPRAEFVLENIGPLHLPTKSNIKIVPSATPNVTLPSITPTVTAAP